MGRRRAGIVAISVVALALAAAGGAWWFSRYEPDPARFPVHGVDVSHHQGPIDWRAVAGDGVAFAYVKASEGSRNQDPLFAANWRGARASGLAVGAYHYFTFCKSGGAQAANFLAAVPHEADALPPAVDLEFGGNCDARPAGPVLKRELAAFLAPVERRDGKAAILYVTPEFLAAYGADLPPRGIWRRSIAHTPDTPWTLWQYHNRGQVRGVRGPVDLNVFGGGRAAFAKFAGVKTRPAKPSSPPLAPARRSSPGG